MSNGETLRSIAYNAKTDDMEKHDGYEDVLEQVRSHIGKTHAEPLAAAITDGKAAEAVRQYISAYVDEKQLHLPGLTMNELTEKLYGDMAGFGFLDKYIRDPEIEEINGNSWDDVEIVTAEGVRKVEEHFASPQRAVDTIRKMARMGGLILDNTSPVVDSWISRGIRISAMIPPCVDKDAGAVFSLRRQRMAKVGKEQLIDWGTATDEMLEFLSLCVNHGISVGFAGKTSSGKTTDISWLLGTVDDGKRIFTIEETRELDLVRTDGKGRVQNRIMHTCTRLSGMESMEIDAAKLLRHSLRFHPDVICVAEMRGAEAMTAQEAARTGHTVVTSLHANSARKAYGRILTMCQMSETKIPSHILMSMIVEAFPVMVFKKQLPDGSRRVMEIVEATGSWEGDVQAETLFRWTGTDFEQVGNVSDMLASLMAENGADAALVRKYSKKKG